MNAPSTSPCPRVRLPDIAEAANHHAVGRPDRADARIKSDFGRPDARIEKREHFDPYIDHSTALPSSRGHIAHAAALDGSDNAAPPQIWICRIQPHAILHLLCSLAMLELSNATPNRVAWLILRGDRRDLGRFIRAPRRSRRFRPCPRREERPGVAGNPSFKIPLRVTSAVSPTTAQSRTSRAARSYRRRGWSR